MSNEQVEKNKLAVDNLNLTARAFGRAILNSEAYKNFINARNEFRNDETAKEAARIYNNVLNDFQMLARWGGITPEDEKKVEEARKIARQNTVLDNYYTSQENLIAFYQELNNYLSEKLKFNFAALAKPAGGCCG